VGDTGAPGIQPAARGWERGDWISRSRANPNTKVHVCRRRKVYMSPCDQRLSQILAVWPSKLSQRTAVQFFLPSLKIRYRKMMIRTIKETPRIIPGNVPLSIRAMTPRNMMASLVSQLLIQV
jgi:hypothetical protein